MSSGRAVWIVLAAFAFGAAMASTAAVAATSDSRVIRASASFQRLGDFRVSDSPTYAGAISALDPPSSCRLVKGRFGADAAHAIATWTRLGVTIELRTYGTLPQARTGCTAPDSIHVHTIRVTRRQWHTSLGLRVGDSAAALRREYPDAKATKAVADWYRTGYWLVARRTACLGDCGGRRLVTAPVLVAEVRRGRVTAIVFVIGAEGE